MEKKISQTVEEVKREHPEARVEAWAEDEHRIGLKPINRIIWVQKGEKVESRLGITPSPSLLNLGVRLSPHPASDILGD